MIKTRGNQNWFWFFISSETGKRKIIEDLSSVYDGNLNDLSNDKIALKNQLIVEDGPYMPGVCYSAQNSLDILRETHNDNDKFLYYFFRKGKGW